MNANTIVSVDWLFEHLDDENLLIFDASMPKATSTSLEVNTKQIVGAQFFDIKHKFSETSSLFPNTIPTEKQFEEEARALGVNSNSVIVIYDDKGIYSAARAWWLFKAFGHSNVSVLDGGLVAWQEKKYPTELKKDNIKQLGNFKASFCPENVIYINDFDGVESENVTIIDARSSNRFNCLVPEPREGLRSGHIPKAINVPFSSLLEAGKMKSENELKEVFSTVLKNDYVIIYCGSGVTACVVALAIKVISSLKVKIYDGSWTEYGTLIVENNANKSEL